MVLYISCLSLFWMFKVVCCLVDPSNCCTWNLENSIQIAIWLGQFGGEYPEDSRPLKNGRIYSFWVYSCWFSAISGMISIRVHSSSHPMKRQASGGGEVKEVPKLRVKRQVKQSRCTTVNQFRNFTPTKTNGWFTWKYPPGKRETFTNHQFSSMLIFGGVNDFHPIWLFTWMLYHVFFWHRKINMMHFFCYEVSVESRPNCLRKSPYHHLRSERLRNVRAAKCTPPKINMSLQKRDQFKRTNLWFSGDTVVFGGVSIGFS